MYRLEWMEYRTLFVFEILRNIYPKNVWIMRKCRIYFRDRITNKIQHFDTKGTRINYDELEKTLKENNKSFMYITNITDGLKEKTPCNMKKHKK